MAGEAGRAGREGRWTEFSAGRWREHDLNGEVQGPLFAWQTSPHGYTWLQIFPLLTVLPAVVILLRGLKRGRLSEAAGATGLVFLPMGAYALAMLLLMEDSKRVTFCGSCHVMTPILESLQQDNGSLASIHFRRGRVSHEEACFVCHSGYGIWGTVDAKMAGIRHMVHTVTGKYERPLKLNGPFDISSCLSCHAQAANFRAVEAHQAIDLQEALMAREMSCTGACHPSAHPDEAIAAGAPAS